MGRSVISKKDIEGRMRTLPLDRYAESDEELEASPEIDLDECEETMDFSVDLAQESVKILTAAPHDAEEQIKEIPYANGEPDRYTSRLLKYIPAEVIALYLTLDSLIRSLEKKPMEIYWAILIFCLIGTYLYLWRVEKVTKNTQLLISVAACFVWVFTIGGPFVYLSWYKPIYGGILLPIYTFLIAIIEA